MLIFAASVALFLAPLAAGREPSDVAQWEQIGAAPQASASDLESEGRMPEVSTHAGYLTVKTPRSIAIKIYTILGQPVAQHSLQPGTWRLRLKARGIYILKCDNITRRITL